jgi:aminoglycoside phosphotransferase (APT) family kinase protein
MSEMEITVDLVAGLLIEQHPDLADLPLRRVAEGWDNLTFRLGDALAVRVPRRQAAASLIEKEIVWLPRLAPQLPLPVPAPVRTGQPTSFYPWRWSVVPWADGKEALTDPLLSVEAARLGAFLRRLHAADVPTDPPRNPFRDASLSSKLEGLAKPLEQLSADTDGASLSTAATATVEAGARAPIDTQPGWIHGDLHPKNVISNDGQLSAIVDWGDMCVGDKATDLACVWMLFDSVDHVDFWNAYGGASNSAMMRARAWAISFGLMIWANHHDADPAFAANGLSTIRRATTP